MRRLVLLAALAGLLLAPSAHAESPLVVGISDDAFKWRPETTLPLARDLGVTAVRVTTQWHPGQSSLSADDQATFDRLLPAALGLRVVVSVFGAAQDAPQTEEARASYCGYVSDLVRRYPTIRDVVIWNEVNLGYFWEPQFDRDGSSAAPAAYELLLARCWDDLHAARADVDVISNVSSRGSDQPRATSNVSHSPVAFVSALGLAYRGSGRTRPILDTVGLHPYSWSNEVPWFDHGESTQVSQGDIPKLVATFGEAFAGTAQPLLGACSSCPRVWLLESGFQTRPRDDKAGSYGGSETDETALADSSPGTLDQATQLRNALELAYCQPTVGAIFNFLLVDEPDLAMWQSGLFWADGTPKGSATAFGQRARAVAHGRVDCEHGPWNGTAARPAPAAPDAQAPSSAQPQAATHPRTAGQSQGGAATSHTSASPAAAPVRTTRPAVPQRLHAAPAAVRRQALRYLAKRFPRGVRKVDVVESRRVRGWFLADGFERRTARPVAAWLHRVHGRVAVVAVATSMRQARGPRSAPCDLRPAFGRAAC